MLEMVLMPRLKHSNDLIERNSSVKRKVMNSQRTITGKSGTLDGNILMVFSVLVGGFGIAVTDFIFEISGSRCIGLMERIFANFEMAWSISKRIGRQIKLDFKHEGQRRIERRSFVDA